MNDVFHKAYTRAGHVRKKLHSFVESEYTRLKKYFSSFWTGFGVCVATSICATFILFTIQFYAEDVQERERALGPLPTDGEEQNVTEDHILSNRRP